MPTQQAHRQQARANRDYANQLLLAGSSEPIVLQWAVTVAFYSAVHCIEAHLATHNAHSTTHVRRRIAMSDPHYPVPSAVYAAYEVLRRESEGARYSMRQFTLQDVQQRVIGRDLAIIAAFVNL